MEILFLIGGGLFFAIGVGIRLAQRSATQGWSPSTGEVVGALKSRG